MQKKATERLKRDSEVSEEERKRRLALLARMGKLRKEIGPIGIPTSELIKEGRRGRWYRETR